MCSLKKKLNSVMLNIKIKCFCFHCYYFMVPEKSQPSVLDHLLILKQVY